VKANVVQYLARWYAGFFWLAATSVACAQTCTLPVPFLYEFQTSVTASLSAANAGDPCALSVALNNGAGPTASGFLHYRRAAPLMSVRYGFHFDATALSDIGAAPLAVQLFAASSPTVNNSMSNILSIYLRGGTQPFLEFIAAAGGNPPEKGAVVELSQLANTLRVEINVGSGTAGTVRYWINHAFTDPPDGVIDNSGAGLDNAAWIGVIGAEIGVSSPSFAFRAGNGGDAVVFDHVESSDDVLFYDDFSSGAQQ
jgi:hypothetical protein